MQQLLRLARAQVSLLQMRHAIVFNAAAISHSLASRASKCCGSDKPRAINRAHCSRALPVQSDRQEWSNQGRVSLVAGTVPPYGSISAASRDGACPCMFTNSSSNSPAAASTHAGQSQESARNVRRPRHHKSLHKQAHRYTAMPAAALCKQPCAALLTQHTRHCFRSQHKQRVVSKAAFSCTRATGAPSACSPN